MACNDILLHVSCYEAKGAGVETYGFCSQLYKLSLFYYSPRVSISKKNYIRGNYDVQNYGVDKSQGSDAPTLKLAVNNKRLLRCENQ